MRCRVQGGPTSLGLLLGQAQDEEPGIEKVPQNHLTSLPARPAELGPGRTTGPNQRSCQGREGATLLIVAGASHSI
eukprot:5465672-Amphidinium_carterae.1